MALIDLLNSVIKNFFLSILTYLVFKKLIDMQIKSKKQIFLILLASLLTSILNSTLDIYINGIIVSYLIYSCFISLITKNDYKYTCIITFISLTIVYVIYIIVMLMSGIILKLIIPDIKENNICILLLGIIFETIMIYSIFRIKRLKRGVLFLKDQKKTYKIGLIGLSLIVLSLYIQSRMDIYNNTFYNTNLVICIFIECICMFIWIRRKITKYYKQKLKENTIQELEKEIRQKDDKIKNILEENEKIATINHKYSSRITALEKISAKILTKPEIISKMKEEFGEDFTELENQIKILTSEYKNEMKESLEIQNKIPKTDIFGIDKLLEYLKEEAESNNIEFNLTLSGSINYMVENVIDQSKLETLLGDHIKDAIIAIHHSNNNYKKILVIIGIIDNYYEVCIYDTGIEFEINTLLKLGTEAITTHKQTGGSGIGFMTTFKTMNETKASLIIEENHRINNTDFTKAVRIRFDGKNQYIVKSYRAEEIISKVKDNRIIIENI